MASRAPPADMLQCRPSCWKVEMPMSEFDLPPQEVRRLGHLAADLVAGHREQLLPRPVFGKVGTKAALFDEPLPEEGMAVEPLLAFVREHVLPYPFGNSH